MQTSRNLCQNDKKQQQPTIESNTKPKPSRLSSFKKLYRFAQAKDYCLIITGTIFSAIAGCSFPFFGLIQGKMFDTFLDSDLDKMVQQAALYRNIFYIIGVSALFTSWIGFASWSIVGDRIAIKCRKIYLQNLLEQEVEWFDSINEFEISSQFNTDAIIYQKAIGEKMGSMVNITAMLICGLAISISVRWTMALVILAGIPVIGFGAFLFIYFIRQKEKKFNELEKQADIQLSQAVLLIKTVKSLNGQQFEEKKYKKYLKIIEEKVWKYATKAGIGVGIFFFIQYSAFAYSCWYSINCVAGSDACPESVTGSLYTPGETVTTFLALFVGSFNFMQLVPNLQTIFGGIEASHRLYEIIDRKTKINKQDPEGYIIPQNTRLKGQITFQNVSFAYPMDKQKKIIENLTMQLKAGQVSALVGRTGAGKSTIIQLLNRFYDPDEGSILIDGRDIRGYNLNSLRKQIGYVGQEPILFDGTIRDNVKIVKPDATQQQIIKALKKSSAWKFVKKLDGKLEYKVGYGGTSLSGGQKQRIAIARAILKDPAILLLDEATSALDQVNERLIQRSLNKYFPNTTKIIIAHRIKTIMSADQIYILKNGTLHEKGTFDQLQYFAEIDHTFYCKEDEKTEKEQEQSLHDKDKNQLQYMKQKQIQQDLQKQMTKREIFARLFREISGYKMMFAGAVLLCLVAGSIHPLSTLLISSNLNKQFEVYNAIKQGYPTEVIEEMVQQGEDYVLYLFFASIFIFFPFALQSALFTKVGQVITQRLRVKICHKILNLPVKFFQSDEFKGGKIATKIGIHSRTVNTLATTLISTLLTNFSTISIGLILSFLYQWRLGLVGLVTLPLLIVSGFISMLFYGGFGDDSEQVYSQASYVSQEAILNIRTVYSNGYEKTLQRFYEEKLEKPLQLAFRKGTKMGLMYGLSQLILQFSFGTMFYFSALIIRDTPDFNLFFIIQGTFSVVWAGWYAGNNFYFLPDVYAGIKAAKTLFSILDEEDEQQIQNKIKSQQLFTPIQGQIELKDVTFTYPNALFPIFSDFSIKIRKGEKVGFVGLSGSGKSTIVQLLERFYDPEKGSILIDGKDIKHFNLHHLRDSLGYINQEPSLFDGTVRQNIQYNKDVDQNLIEEASRIACAQQFILDHEKGYDRNVGFMGGRVSGGQKQRIAIARTIVRNPAMLLMDEATSALDSRTQHRVQVNIDERMKTRTQISIAHRFETIQNSDRIFVLDQGRLLEQGSFSQLIQRKHYFYNLSKGYNVL